ncbi:TPA: integrase core domain-containing protein, partial [Escherichia coli]|nr:transposase [Escherichia coli]HDL6814343.1 transposase [Escherichia coli 371_08]HDL7561458.1 transposase [Escherichia coli 151_06]EES5042796.1 transposase [Escherichia coli]EET4089305.1 transposase [Escherichia coli]
IRHSLRQSSDTVLPALHNLAVAIEHYNENHPHSALGYCSPREYRRQWVTLT